MFYVTTFHFAFFSLEIKKSGIFIVIVLCLWLCGFMTFASYKNVNKIILQNCDSLIFVSFSLAARVPYSEQKKTISKQTHFDSLWLLTLVDFQHVIDMLAVVTHLVQRQPVYHDPTAIICKAIK